MQFKSFMQDGVPTLRIEDPAQLTGLRLIDVRSAEEYTGELGHIQNAELVTLGPELQHFLESSDREQPILFICRSGARSGRATDFALSLGYKQVFNMEGGMMLWNQLGLPREC
jgi:sulfur dioxygenase